MKVEKAKQEMYSSVFNTKQGQEVIDDLDKFTGFFADTFVPDSNTNAYMLGQRRVLLRILSFTNNRDASDMAERFMNE